MYCIVDVTSLITEDQMMSLKKKLNKCSKELHIYSDKSKCQLEFSVGVSSSPPVVSSTLLNSSSKHTSSLILQSLSALVFFFFFLSIHFTCVLFLIGDPCSGFVSLLGLRMRLLAFVRLSEVERE